MWVSILGLLAVIYGAATLYIAWFKPPRLWNIPKIQAFVSLLSETGTVIFFTIVAIAAIALGVTLLF